jgi:hypothetical protein
MDILWKGRLTGSSHESAADLWRASLIAALFLNFPDMIVLLADSATVPEAVRISPVMGKLFAPISLSPLHGGSG